MNNVEIIRLNHSGEGIGKINNKTIFIPKTIVGDIVSVNIIEEHKNYLRGSIIEYIKRPTNCLNPKCKYYYKCGGCHLSNLSYQDQLTYKENKIKDIFKKYLNKEISPKIIKSNKEYEYRNKITLQIKDGKLGLYKNKTNDIIEIDKCLLVSNNINKVINNLKQYNLNKVTNIVIKESNNEIMLYIEGNISKDIINIDNVNTIIINNNIIKGNGYITQNISNLKYIVSPKSFYQVNNNTVEKLYNKILEYSNLNKEDKVIDLYCGTGTIGIYLSRYCKEVLGIEINDSSIKDANNNIKLNNINNVKFIKGDVGKIINNNYKADVIVVDPPRRGLDKITRKTLLEISPKKIIYVSCDPMTLARDLKDLLIKYNLEDISIVDMFPQTYHCESVAVLERK